MKDSLKNKCDLLVTNRNIVKDALKWDNSLIYPLCAFIYTEKGMTADALKLKAAKEIIKRNAGIFSNFRGISQNVLATMLSLEPEPEAVFADIQSVHSKLKAEFRSSNYLPLTAFIIARMAQAGSYDNVVLRTKSIYKLMKEEHPFLTSGEDCAFAALFALSDKAENDIVAEMENCYTRLKKRFFSSNAVQSLSHVLALGEEDAESKCSRFIELFDLLKDRKLKYGTTYELATLGTLVLTGRSINRIADDIAEVDRYLKAFKGFGTFAIGQKQRLMYAAMLTSLEYSGESDTARQTAAFCSVTAMIIAQQAAMTATIAASTVATTAAGSGG